MSRRVIPVSTLVHYLKESMDSNPILHGVFVEGEISNMRIPSSGHWYFSLKDTSSTINCVMFASANRRIDFKPKNGDKVILTGDVSVYESGGSLQILAQGMRPSGIGTLFLELEALKKKLAAEGLFDEEHKKPLPHYPMDIALITGNQTAGRKDVLITLHNRWPVARIHEFNCRVQGNDAGKEIALTVQKADAAKCDVILLVRGGGSFEELYCFNDETLARAIYACDTPLVTGIGHETDFTVADYVADLRANTPTGAIATAVPDIHEVKAELNHQKARLEEKMKSVLMLKHREFDHLKDHVVFTRPERLYSEQANNLNYLEERLKHTMQLAKQKRNDANLVFNNYYAAMQTIQKDLKEQLQQQQNSLFLITKKNISKNQEKLLQNQHILKQMMLNSKSQSRQKFVNQVQLLDAYSPLKSLQRGYSVVMKDGVVVDHVDAVAVDDVVSIRLQDGEVGARIVESRKQNGKEKNDI